MKTPAESYRQHHPENAVHMKPIIADFLTSKAGWITRKAIDSLTPLLAAYAAKLIEAGAPSELTTGLTSAILAGVTWGIGLLLSKLADTANKELPAPKP